MQSPTVPADRIGTIGVEAFDAIYGASFQASDDSRHAVECELVEDGGAFVAHRPTRTVPAASPFADGLAGSWAAGDARRWKRTGTPPSSRAAGPVYLPDQRNGWCWEPYAVDGADVEAAPQQFQHLMRDAEADIAEALSNASWVTMVDGPLHGIRHPPRPGHPSAT